MAFNDWHFDRDIANFESIIDFPKRGLVAIDSLREYIVSRNQFFSDRDFETKTWGIAPLLDNRINSHLTSDMPIGVILKLRF